jgi:hypothetical protein
VSYEVVVERGPLPDRWRDQVMSGWGRYDPRLLDPEEWASEFELGPEGPALHVLVVRDGDQVVGHHSAIPLRFLLGREEHVLGKGEAIYVDRDRVERGARVEVDGRRVRPVEALASVLFERCREFGLEAYIGYAQPQSERRLVEAGCSVVSLPHRRYFFFHDAGAALSRSAAVPAVLRAGARLALGGQRALGRLRHRGGADADVREVERFDARDDDAFRAGLEQDALALDPSAARLNWRFAGHGYRLLTIGTPPWGYAVLSPLEGTGRRRIVDWLVPAERAGEAASIADALIAAGADAAALEWVVPTGSSGGRQLAARLARSRLLRHPRRGEHRMVVYGDSRFKDAERWSLTLATHERF